MEAVVAEEDLAEGVPAVEEAEAESHLRVAAESRLPAA